MLAAPTFCAPSSGIAADRALQQVACLVNLCCPVLSCGLLSTHKSYALLCPRLPCLPSPFLVYFLLKVNDGNAAYLSVSVLELLPTSHPMNLTQLITRN